MSAASSASAASSSSVPAAVCLVCAEPGGLRCSSCGQACYCGREHQVQHWKSAHKAECKGPCEIKAAVHGKGLALFATRPCRVGERLVSEAPLLASPAPASAEDIPAVTKIIQFRYDVLDEASKKKVFAFGDAYLVPGEKASLVGLALTNQLPVSPQVLGVGLQSGNAGAIFERLSRAQHSCAPNAEYSWNTILGKGVLHAIVPIAEGEEVTISYVSTTCTMTREQRRNAINEGFRFVCECAYCVKFDRDHAALQASDSRRTRIGVLLASLMSDENARMPLSCLRSLDEIRKLLALEGYGLPSSVLGRLAFRLYQICICHTLLKKKATEQVAESIAIYTQVRGADADVVQQYSTLRDKPESHPDFGVLDNEKCVQIEQEIMGIEDLEAMETKQKQDKQAEAAGADKQ